MIKRMGFMGVVAFTIAMSISYAGVPILPPSMQPTQPLLVVGHLDAWDKTTGIAIVLGQKIHVPANASFSPYLVVGVFGTILPDGSVNASTVEGGSLYLAGSTPVYLTGVVTQSNPAIGQITIEGVKIDITQTLSITNGITPAAGSVVQLAGIQPLEGGIILAGDIRIGAAQIAANPLINSLPPTGWALAGTGITGSGRSPPAN
jgi:hypothetical protein